MTARARASGSSGRNDSTRNTVDNRLKHATDASADDRDPAGHSFDNRDSETLAQRWIHHDIGGAIFGYQLFVGQPPGEIHAVFKTALPYQLIKVVLIIRAARGIVKAA